MGPSTLFFVSFRAVVDRLRVRLRSRRGCSFVRSFFGRSLDGKDDRKKRKERKERRKSIVCSRDDRSYARSSGLSLITRYNGVEAATRFISLHALPFK